MIWCKKYKQTRHYLSVMEKKDYLLLKAKEAGYDSLEAYVRGNLHYLPKDRQEVFSRAFKYKAQGVRYGKG